MSHLVIPHHRMAKPMSRTVFYIKLVHAVLFFLIGMCMIYVLLAAVFDHINWVAWIAFSVMVIELLALVLNGWHCPLTNMAERHGAKVGSIADLFLPVWLSDRLFPVFGIVFVITCLLLVWRLLF